MDEFRTWPKETLLEMLQVQGVSGVSAAMSKDELLATLMSLLPADSDQPEGDASADAVGGDTAGGDTAGTEATGDRVSAIDEDKVTFRVRWRTTTYKVVLPRAATLAELKRQVYEHTGVLVADQVIEGVTAYGAALTDDTSFLELDMVVPVYDVTMSGKPVCESSSAAAAAPPPSSTASNWSSHRMSNSNDDARAFRAVLRSAATAGRGSRVSGPVVRAPSRSAALQARKEAKAFTTAFEAEFGTGHPPFFDGALEEAFHSATALSRFVVVVLHNSDAEFSQQFCEHILCSEYVREVVVMNALVWARNVAGAADERNPHVRKLAAVAETGLSRASLVIDQYPVVACVGAVNGEMALLSARTGYVTVDDMVACVLEAAEAHSRRADDERVAMSKRLKVAAAAEASLTDSERAERDERERLAAERTAMREQQDAAYQASLAADRAKAKAKAEAEAKATEAKLAAERVMLEEARAAEAAATRLASLKDALPTEPEADGADVVTVAVRTSSGRLQRRFTAATLFDTVLDWLEVEGIKNVIGVASTYPRKQYGRGAGSLSEAGFSGSIIFNVCTE
ncbi:uncharacterized protein AMSG_08625 [Thecamonas trahens ATCC 50062]|uniref:UAS domain-containing protein n=1 Tax=Thecamonas trahens ATCC 50062 TaxID=461836 RepID=A0A0L0DKJ8_THETB|nr:hypothetical protein AMSG_08625 [Thecamonas trahens ATCC 50062]KNC52745.1 hypothetical protein AMSG_08625 [Thecamonas trahens ATCC 50062]|eukprot:XP_013755059.1 hypothetical protein AMSG_08625 [Thecamonas trahens ATCC 50062]